MLTAYMDESYGQEAICVGGWITSDENWDAFQAAWKARIEKESQDAQKHGLMPLPRYHATDCANCKNAFEGWSIDRQIAFTKDLLQIVARFELRGFAFGASLRDISSVLSDDLDAEKRKHITYGLCIRLCLQEIGKYILRDFPLERITVIHDSGGLIASAQEAFSGLMEDEGSPERDAFISLAPMRWQDCVALQAADLLAYEGMKLTADGLLGKENVRKALQAIVDERLLLFAGYLPLGSFETFARRIRDEIDSKALEGPR